MLFALEEASSPWAVVAGLLSVPVLIVVNGMFVAAQFALVALRQTRVEEMTRQGVTGAKAVAQAMDNLDRCIAATQLGTVLVGLLLGWVGEPAVADLLRPFFDRLAIEWHETAFRSLSTILTFFLITFLSVVFGELIPKTVGLQNNEGTALWLARPLLWFTRLVHPLVLLMDGTGNRLLRWIGYDPEAEMERPHSADELVMLIEDSAEAGVVPAAHATLVKNLLRLAEKKAADVLVPAEKMGVIEYGADPEAILKRIREGTFTRMPVYQGTLDNILGVANTKQLLRNYTVTDVISLDDVVYPAVFVAPEDPLPKVMKVLREARFPMAIVRGADGRVLGLLTLEDVLEEVIGDIVDEHDYPAPKMTARMLQALVKTLPKRKGGSVVLPKASAS
jgi:CBS domain containing-hemolysin-like protein